MTAHDRRPAGVAIGAALAGGAALCAYALPALAGISTSTGSPVLPALRRALGIADRTPSGRGFALTFDDGPHPQGTPAVLELLAGAHIQATFFLVGEQVRRAPGLVAEILAGGHAIGLHCDRHRNLLRLTPRQVADDLARAEDTIEAASGRAIELYRPPFGILNAAALRQARRRRWRVLLWQHWGRDWQATATPESIAARVTAGAGEGGVLLLHDADDYSAAGSWKRTAQALPRVLDILAARGLKPEAL